MVSAAFTLESPSFKNNQEIPAQYTCEGENISPPLSWSNPPKGTKSFAIIVDDPDAPDPQAPKTTWVHWVLFNIPESMTSLPEGIHDLPQQTHQGLNDWKAQGYRGPCPPIGKHHYHHKLYALDTVLPELGRPTKADLERSMRGHILAQTELVGTYLKKK
ncbi:YbhB/YbcL family Raf kinase inhibitor-like protein [Bdellovibrio svalbardensis]|uniref:YbhB/YbcL family Raf kinase inhibitor-like protein n=1 Tax=Bdellovibrio svalbardensis TaxID=2972972 RepID=A0ABT6DLR6_9BACT|nr:YbhB/YbcL family Raf kinase inhibitor-like protein [Bdellovibrio svalbardensis]MDG0817823.1 YbhB/YbcL family Raf kinase inhibitor-like protein [Bdellovibrio svalbardensis]